MRILTYGTFDTLHYGHVRLLKRARALGTHLTVALSTDEFNKLKGKQAVFSWEERKADLEGIEYVDAVIPEHNWEQKKKDVADHKIDIFTMGDDWAGEFDFLKDQCKVVYLKRTDNISSTMIRNLWNIAMPLEDKTQDDETLMAAQREARIKEIHHLAISELAMPSGNLQTRRLFVELRELETRPQSIEWLEASILMSVFRKARPMKALSTLNKLRIFSKTEAEKDRFERFSTAVANHLSPTLLTNHGYVEPDSTFGEVSHDQVWAALSGHINALVKAGLRIFLNSGTLLGLVRDGHLIKHDNDIDLGVVLTAKTESGAAKQWDALPAKLEKLGLLEEFTGRNHGLLRLKPVAGFTVDLFPAWVAKKKVYVFPHTYGDLVPADLLPFAKCEITGHNIPAKPEKMLAINYGPGWKEKDPLWKFVQPAGFGSFLEKVKPT